MRMKQVRSHRTPGALCVNLDGSDMSHWDVPPTRCRCRRTRVHLHRLTIYNISINNCERILEFPEPRPFPSRNELQLNIDRCVR